MRERTVGVGVIGLRMGQSHLEGYAQNPKAKIVAVCDMDRQLLDRQKNEFNAGIAVTDYRELLSIPEVEAVSIATPDCDHTEQSIAAMKKGKDVLCEKPLTLNLGDARSIIRVVKETGRRFMVGQVCRYAPGFILARKMVERGEIGDLFFVESEYAHNYAKSAGSGNWRKDPRREPFIGGGCHAVDLLRWIAGDPLEVFALSNHKCLTDWPVNDCTVAVYKFPNNVIGKAMVSIGCIRPYTMRSVFYGTEGTIVCDNTSPEIQCCSQRNIGNKSSFANFSVEINSHNVAAEIREFLDCIIENRPVVTTAVEGAKTVAACVAAVESARTGAPVKIEMI